MLLSTSGQSLHAAAATPVVSTYPAISGMDAASLSCCNRCNVLEGHQRIATWLCNMIGNRTIWRIIYTTPHHHPANRYLRYLLSGDRLLRWTLSQQLLLAVASSARPCLLLLSLGKVPTLQLLLQLQVDIWRFICRYLHKHHTNRTKAAAKVIDEASF